jgi:hypothetical protein
MSSTQEYPLLSSTSALFWDINDVTRWLSSINLEIYISQFEWHCVDGLCLLELTACDLRLLDVAHRDQSHLQRQIDLLRSNLIHEIEMWDNKSVRKWFLFNGFTRSQASFFRFQEFDGHKFLSVTRQSMTRIGVPKYLQKKVLFLQILALGQTRSQLNQTQQTLYIQHEQPSQQSSQQPSPTITPSKYLQHNTLHCNRQQGVAKKFSLGNFQSPVNSAPVTSLLHLWKPRQDERRSKLLCVNSEPIKSKKQLKSDEIYIEVQSVCEDKIRWRLFREDESFDTFQKWVESEYGPNYKAKCWFAGQVGGICSDTDITMLCRLGRMNKAKVILHEVPLKC